MKLLLVTEKCCSSEMERDGGARLVTTLQRAFGDALSVMQFGPEPDHAATWHFKYPFNFPDRFARRLANANFIAEQVKSVENSFTHVLFVHISMQFGLVNLPLRDEVQIWTFPMFLTSSYVASGERVMQNYLEIERRCLAKCQHILTPSHLEKRQLIDDYSVPKESIHVVPRGIDRRLLTPKQRSFCGSPKFCSVGSIKPQKNTLGLIVLFKEILSRYPDAYLRIIGPIQNNGYYDAVCSEINRLGLRDQIEITGHIPPHKLATVLDDAHLHLSASTCETFGRSIFETLASGLPNIARSTGNAAAEYLAHLPYACFTDDEDEVLIAIDRMLTNLPGLSKMALEIGQFYDDGCSRGCWLPKSLKKRSLGLVILMALYFTRMIL